MIRHAIFFFALVGCSSTEPTPDASTAADAAADAAAEASSGPVAAGCMGSIGGGGVSTCYENFKCSAAQYRIDCACPQATCTCSAADGGVYRTVSFDCDAGCTFPLSSAASDACGLNP